MLFKPEIYGIQAVPASAQTEGFWTVFVLFFNILLNPGTLISSGLMIADGFSIASTISLQVFSVLCSFLLILPVCLYCARQGIPGQVLCRRVFGLQGSRYLTSLSRLVVSLYWFAFQAIATIISLDFLLKSLQIHLPYVVLLLSVVSLQIIVSYSGFWLLKKVANLLLVIKTLLFILLGILLAKQIHSEGHFQASQATFLLPVEKTFIWFNAIIVATLSGVTEYSDLLRYNKKVKDISLGMLCGAGLGTLIASSFSAVAVTAIQGTDPNPFAVFSAHYAIHPGLVVLIMITLLADIWLINSFNLYSAGFCFNNIFSQLSRAKATAIVSMLAILFTLLQRDAVTHYVYYMSYFGILFVPITGILTGYVFQHWKKEGSTALSLQKMSYKKYVFLGFILVAGCSLYSGISHIYLPTLITVAFCSLIYLKFMHFFR